MVDAANDPSLMQSVPMARLVGKHDRLARDDARGDLLAWALGVWAGTYYEAQRSDYEESEAQPYHGTLDRSTFWQERPGTSESYKAICGGPIDESQADLCQQWRSANAAEQMAGYALVSLLFGFAGLIGVGITVHLSNKATNAATEATKAAIEANEISRRIGEAQTRAYMSAAEGRAEIVRFNYGKGIKSIPSYLDELRSNGVRRNDGRRLGGRIERAKEDDEDDEIW